MSNFALDTNTSYGDVISSVNYLLANLPPNLSANAIIAQAGNVVTVNSNTGALSSNSVGTLSYLYDYVNIKYANSSTGGTGFTSNSTMATYYGTHNTTDGSISNNPVDYQWVQVAGGFGTTKGLYHTNLGGGKVYFAVATVAPSIYYTPVIDDQPIFLQNLANSIVVANSIQPGAVTNVAIAANTIIGTNIQDQAITALQIASRTLTNAQIALSTITGNLVQSQTLTGSLIALNTITGNLVAQNTITGNLIVPGTITGNLITANTTITSTITSYGVTPGVNSGYGFWMTSNVGDAYFGGNITIGNNGVIGNNLVIGNNAVIGGNLTVAGLITSANLNANTVATSTMQLNSATTTGAVNNSGYVINNPIVSFGSYDGSYYNYLTGNLIPAGGVVQATTSIVTNVISGYLDVSGVTNTNGIFGVPQMYAELYRTTDGINFTPISQTFITTPASQQFNATYAQTTQTLLPVRLSAVSIVDVFTITSPTNVGYYWLWGAYISQTSNVKPIQSNVTLGTYGVTVTNYKR